MIEVAVIGLSESGKTVYLTSLINHLLRKDLNGVIRNISLDSEPSADSGPGLWGSLFSEKASVVQFPYEEYLERFLGADSLWPKRTKDVSEYVLKVVYKKDDSGGLKEFKIKLFDYPGELFADFPMLDQTYAEWSSTIMRVLRGKQNTDWEAIYMKNADKNINELGKLYFDEVHRLEKAGYNYIQPSKYFGVNDFKEIKEDELFFPVPVTSDNKRDEIVCELERRFERYKLNTVVPNFELLRGCSYQIILFDVLTALTTSISHYNDVSYTVEKILEQFDYTAGYGILNALLSIFYEPQKPIKKILFLATKADMVKKNDRGKMVVLLKKLVETALKKIKLKAGSVNRSFSAEVDCVSAMRCTKDVETGGEEELAIMVNGKLEKIKNSISVPDDWPANEKEFEELKSKNKMLSLSPNIEVRRHDYVFPDINLDKPFLKLIEEEFK